MTDGEVRLLRAELSNLRASAGRISDRLDAQLRDLNERLIRLEVRMEQKPDKDVILHNIFVGAAVLSLVIALALSLAAPVP